MSQPDNLSSLLARALGVLVSLDTLPTGDEALRSLLEAVVSEYSANVSVVGAEAQRELVTALYQALRGIEGGKTFEIVPQLCDCDEGQVGGAGPCQVGCPVGAIALGPDGKAVIDHDRCIECGFCVHLCTQGAVSASPGLLPLLGLLRGRGAAPVYAMVAPSFAGQLGDDVSDAQFRLAMRRLGFRDCVEVALAADLVTRMEADEYVERMAGGERFMITSCCCPAFVKLVDRLRPKVAHLVSHTVSPMVGMARLLKAREPECRVVFLSPCLAKRAEARDPQFAADVDAVVTFAELRLLLEAAGLSASAQFGGEVAGLEQASHDGRIYARVGGVTHAIHAAVREKAPDLALIGVVGDGIRECAAMLGRIEEGDSPATFMEGMGCVGGCVGGPATLRPKGEGTACAERYARSAKWATALSNTEADAISDGADVAERLTASRGKALEPVGV